MDLRSSGTSHISPVRLDLVLSWIQSLMLPKICNVLYPYCGTPVSLTSTSNWLFTWSDGRREQLQLWVIFFMRWSSPQVMRPTCFNLFLCLPILRNQMWTNLTWWIFHIASPPTKGFEFFIRVLNSSNIWFSFIHACKSSCECVPLKCPESSLCTIRESYFPPVFSPNSFDTMFQFEPQLLLFCLLFGLFYLISFTKITLTYTHPAGSVPLKVIKDSFKHPDHS